MGLYNRLLQELSRKSRHQKFDLFRTVFEPQPKDLILDIGATGSYFPLYTFEDFYPYPERIVGGGIAFEEVKSAKQIYPFSNYVAFDGCELPFRDKSFDIVFSNAVIEHVLDKGRQARFAREVMRVGKSWFVTTPNYWFPFDSYSYLLFIQFLPRSMQRGYKHLFAAVAGVRSWMWRFSRRVACGVSFPPVQSQECGLRSGRRPSWLISSIRAEIDPTFESGASGMSGRQIAKPDLEPRVERWACTSACC
jgi:hypothetical protein